MACHPYQLCLMVWVPGLVVWEGWRSFNVYSILHLVIMCPDIVWGAL